MNLILMVLRLVLGVLFPSRRDGLSLAARVDGRMQQVPQGVWSWLLGESRPRASGPPAPPGLQKAAPRGLPLARTPSSSAGASAGNP